MPDREWDVKVVKEIDARALSELVPMVNDNLQDFIHVFWEKYVLIRNESMNRFRESPRNVPALSAPMRMLLSFRNELKRLDSNGLADEVRKTTVAATSLITEQIQCILSNIPPNHECGQCDHWKQVFVEGPVGNDNKDISIWIKVGFSDKTMSSSHPGPNLKPFNKGTWPGLSRREKLVILHCILMFQYNPSFKHTFQADLRIIEIYLKEEPSECNCCRSGDLMVEYTPDYNPNSYGHLLWLLYECYS
jgi:hypothetical protein